MYKFLNVFISVITSIVNSLNYKKNKYHNFYNNYIENSQIYIKYLLKFYFLIPEVAYYNLYNN